MGVVQCEFEECDDLIFRVDQDNHNKKCMQKHLLLLQDAHQQYVQDSELERDVLKEQCSDLEGRCDDLEAKYDDLTDTVSTLLAKIEELSK